MANSSSDWSQNEGERGIGLARALLTLSGGLKSFGVYSVVMEEPL